MQVNENPDAYDQHDPAAFEDHFDMMKVQVEMVAVDKGWHHPRKSNERSNFLTQLSVLLIQIRLNLVEGWRRPIYFLFVRNCIVFGHLRFPC